MTPRTHRPAPTQTPPRRVRGGEQSSGGPARPPARTEAPAGGGDQPGADERRTPAGAAWLLLLPLLCCGGPLLLAAAASAGALGWGALGAGIAVLIAAGILAARRQLTRGGAGRQCCDPAAGEAPSPRQAVRTPGRDPRW
jgi:hypothetical protein